MSLSLAKNLVVASLAALMLAGCNCGGVSPGEDGGTGGSATGGSATGGGTGGGATGGGTGGATGGGTGGATGALTITTTTLPPGVQNVAYTASLAASGGATPYTWAVTGGALPAGLSLSAAGVISGTPTGAGSFTFTVQATDASSPALTATASLGLVVAAPLNLSVANPPPNGTVGTAYSSSFLATGGTPPYSFTMSVGSAPQGLTLSAAGTLAGTPTATGSSTFTVMVTDSSTPAQTAQQPFTVVINGAGVLAVTTSALPSGLVGAAYSTALTAANGTPPYTWSVSSGTLQAGLTLAADGTLSGTPTAAGTQLVTFRVQDSTSPTKQAATAQLSVVVVAPLVISTASLPAGAQASAYSTTLAATGGVGPYTWSIASGTLPAGITLGSATGKLSGTPTQSGTFSFTVQVMDAEGNPQTATASLSLTLAPLLSIGTTSLPSGVVGTAYSQALVAAGGTTPYAWTVTAGSLPAGLASSAGGVISGTPTTTGVATFTVQVADASNPMQTVTQALQLPVNGAGVLTITTASTPTGVQGQTYSASFAATGGTTPYTWSVASGALPAGLSLSSAGALTGTPTTAGSANVTIQVSDTSVPQQVTTAPFTIVVAAPLAVSTTTLSSGITGSAYSATLAATGGTGTMSWTITSGALPAGLSLSASGAITGTPTASGTFAITVKVTDSGSPSQSATANLSLTVTPALVITTASLPNGVMGTGYSNALSASGGTPAYAWSVTGGALPTGLSLSAGGTVSGTPTATGSFTVQITVTDSGAPAQSVAKSYTVFINGAGTLTITTGSVPSGIQGTAYTTTLVASGGTTPYTWSVVAGSLPPGLSINAGTGVISGTPTAAGSYAFTAQVTDSTSPAAKTATQLLQLTIVTPLTVTTTALANAVQGVGYSASLAATGGATPYTWSLSSGTLPPGLTLNAGTGVISGTPTTAGTSNFAVKVTDSGVPVQNAIQALSIVVAAPLAITSTSPAPPGVVNVAYSDTVVATGGNTPYTFSITGGTLPAGLTLNTTTGVISGTPTTAGTSFFRVQVQDSSVPVQTATRFFLLTISPALTITTTALSSGTVGVNYLANLAAAGGNQPYTWSVTSGALPPGLTLNTATGAISGTPTTSGPYNFTVQVSDSTNPAVTATKALSILVNPAGTLTVSTLSLPDGVRTQPYPSTTLTASGGTTPYTWAVTGSALPPGLTLSAGGVISGTPTANGTYTFTVTVTDSTAPTANTATKTLSITVRAPLVITSPSPLPVAVINAAYNVTLTAAGGRTPYTWAVTSGALPAGLSLSAAGAITGTPTGPAGPVTFTVQVTDSASPAQVVTKALTINVDTRITITSPGTLTAGKVGTAYTYTLAEAGGTGPFTWAVAFGNLPAGLTLNAATGVISGTPTTAGTVGFIVSVTDAYGQVVMKLEQITIAP